MFHFLFRVGCSFYISGRYIIFMCFFELTPRFLKSYLFIKCYIHTNIDVMESEMYILKALETSQYPTNIPLFPEVSNLVLFYFGMWTYTGQPNILIWITSSLFLVYIYSRVLNPIALWDNLFCTYTTFLASSTHRFMGRSWSWIIVFTASIMVLFFLFATPFYWGL